MRKQPSPSPAKNPVSKKDIDENKDDKKVDEDKKIEEQEKKKKIDKSSDDEDKQSKKTDKKEEPKKKELTEEEKSVFKKQHLAELQQRQVAWYLNRTKKFLICLLKSRREIVRERRFWKKLLILLREKNLS